MRSNHGSGACRWISAEPDTAQVQTLAASLDCPRWLAGLLVGRGLSSPDIVQKWLDPKLKDLADPFLLPGMDAAVDRILAAIQRRESITVFGDYDVDGLTGVALLASLLQHAGSPFKTFLPHRLDEGYGLSVEALDRCLTETSPALIVTVDCGTGSVAAVEQARARGVDVIITDHHAVSEGVAPALSVVNPRLSPDESMHVLAGVGVAFKLCHALLKRGRQLPDAPAWTLFDPKDVLDLVALGTVADLVPLTGENRLLVHHGLKALNRTKRPGLNALIKVAGIKKQIDTYEVGYLLGPRLNASGRLGTAQTSLKLLLTGSNAEAEKIAAELDAANRERQGVERAMVQELKTVVAGRFSRAETFSIVEADPAWHPGVIGIAAARLVQEYFRPAIVIGSDDQGRGKGSCRSIPGFNMVEALAECRPYLVKFGGHAMAAGLEVEWGQVEAFRLAFEQVSRRLLQGRELVPELKLDAWLDTRDINDRLVDLLEKLRPFGIGHPEPLWGGRGLAISGTPREVGKGHLKVNLVCQGREWEAIGFGLYGRPLPEGPIDAAFHLRKDEYLGKTKLVLHLKDLQASSGGR